MPGEEKKPTKKRTTAGTKKTSNVKSASGTSADKKTSTKKLEKAFEIKGFLFLLAFFQLLSF